MMDAKRAARGSQSQISEINLTSTESEEEVVQNEAQEKSSCSEDKGSYHESSIEVVNMQ